MAVAGRQVPPLRPLGQARLRGSAPWTGTLPALQDLKLIGELLAEGQAHLFSAWGREEEAGRRRLLGQLRHLDRSYTGGLPRYIRNARQLLKESKEGVARGCRGAGSCLWLQSLMLSS